VRNSKWIRPVVTAVIILAVIAVLYALFFGKGSLSKDTSLVSDAELLTAFPDKGDKGASLSSEYRKVADNERLELWLKEQNLSIQVVDKSSGYKWSSEIIDTESNEAWRNFMASGLSLEYFEENKPNAIRTDLVTQTNKSITFESLEHGFKAIIRLNDLQIGMEILVSLEQDQLVVSIPQQSILEGNKMKLASIFVYPFLGATKAGEIDGYMFIPDGSGALIRYADNKGKFKIPFEAKIYGTNEGIETADRDIFTNPPYTVQFPVFGMVHGEGRNAVFGIVENGQYNAKVLAYPSGVNTPYNWTTIQFLSRESYLQPTSRSLGGIIVYEKDRNPEDIQLRYTFLNGKDASYAGMARTYQAYLKEKSILIKKEQETNTTIPLQMDILGAETENGMFAKRLIPMTTVSQLEEMLEDMNKNGIENVNVVYKGWNVGGLSGTSPSPVKYEAALGSNKDFERLAASLLERGTQLHLYSDFTTGNEASKRFSAQADAAKKIDKSLLTIPTFEEVYDKIYYLSAEATSNLIKQNAKKYAEQIVTGVAVDTTGSVLFSELIGGKQSSRSQTAVAYTTAIKELADRLSSMLIYAPNDYMLAYASQVLDVPMDSSQYIYISHTVPFVQMVLKGYKDYYAPYSNFFANPQTSLLRMIETASYPSYYLTYETSYKLKHTNSNDIYTSAYDDWRESMLAAYRILNEALQPTIGAAMADHEYLSDDIVKVSYDNGIAVLVNYTKRDYQWNGISVPARGFQVIEVNR